MIQHAVRRCICVLTRNLPLVGTPCSDRPVCARTVVGSCVRPRGGGVAVELALVLPILLTFLFGGIEWGLIARDAITLRHVVRDAARDLAVGETPDEVAARIAADAGVNAEALDVTCERRTFDATALTFGSWTDLGTDGDVNDADSGDQVRVRVTHRHDLVFDGLCVPEAQRASTGELFVTAEGTALRE